MKLTKTKVDAPQAAAPQATGNPNLDAQLAKLTNAQTLDDVGAALRDIKSQLPGARVRQFKGALAQVGNAFKSAMGNRPGGVRPLMSDIQREDVKLFCGEATPDGVKVMADAIGVAVGTKDFQIFSTGDPFTFLGTPPNDKKGIKGAAEDVKDKTVMIVQGSESYVPKGDSPRFDTATLVAEALQIAFAAKSNGAAKTIVVLPESLNPATHPDDQFAALTARLAKASGVDEVRYNASLDNQVADATTTRQLRAGLETLGPKTKEAERGLANLGAAGDLDSIAKALTQLDLALTGLKGKYDAQASAFAKQVASVLTERVASLVPGLPFGAAGLQDGRAVVFAGQSNPELSAAIAEQMGAKSGSHAVDFSGGNPFVQLGADVRGKPAVIVQTTRQDPFTAPEAKHSSMALLAEALLLCDQAQKAGASETTFVMPYMPNARSDKVDQKGVGAYASLVARWVDEIGVDKIVMVEPHDIHVPAFFRTNQVRVISGAEVLTKRALADLGRDNLVLVRPDEGATKRTKSLAKDLDLPMVNGQKSRSDNSETASVDALGSKSDVEGKTCLVNDDEIATGGTMRQTVTMLKENGAAQVHVAISHANMPTDPEQRHEAMRKLKDAGADSLYLLDTQPVGRVPPDLADFVKVVSIASAIAGEAK